MQLFNLGLVLLNQDGSPKLDDSGNQIPAYTEAQVQAFARAFTGWTYANPDGSTPTVFPAAPNYYNSLVPIASWHDETAKTLLNGTTLPAGQSAEQDMANALTNVFQHPNVPPFVSLQLIQHLVKSDPSPGLHLAGGGGLRRRRQRCARGHAGGADGDLHRPGGPGRRHRPTAERRASARADSLDDRSDARAGLRQRQSKRLLVECCRTFSRSSTKCPTTPRRCSTSSRRAT